VNEGELGLTPETILDLPVESLALAILQNYAEAKSWNQHNWMGGALRSLGRGPHIEALAEAWSWLESKALVAQHPDQSSAGARIITRAGKRVLANGSLEEIKASERIGLELHPRLQGKIRPIFLLGDYETAAFKAMKEVEVRVRELSGLANDLIGVALIRQAFNCNSGPLTDQSNDKGERQARSDLFAGAIGSFKNPTSHRIVTYQDPIQASEVILIADLLMRILDTIESKASEK
jgi:uncharacterized protein (TIGR02391 family)